MAVEKFFNKRDLSQPLEIFNPVSEREVRSLPFSEIINLVKQEPEAIEPGIIAVDSDIVIPNVADIDLVAISNYRLLLISVLINLSVEDLKKCNGINRWYFENASVLNHLYGSRGLNQNSHPKVVFLCSRINPDAFPLVSLLTGNSLEVLKYKCVEDGRRIWLSIEKPRLKPPSGMPKSTQVELTAEELGAFFDEKPESSMNPPEFGGPYFTKT